MKKLSSKLVSASDHICISATLNTLGIDKRLWKWELEHVREVLVMLLLPSTMILIETPWFHPDCRGGSEPWASVNMLGCQWCIPISPSPRWTGCCKRKQTVWALHMCCCVSSGQSNLNLDFFQGTTKAPGISSSSKWCIQLGQGVEFFLFRLHK